MGHALEYKCKDCGNIWTHYAGVGFEMKPISGSKEDNITGDADKTIKCPLCDSTNFEEASDGITILWD